MILLIFKLVIPDSGSGFRVLLLRVVILKGFKTEGPIRDAVMTLQEFNLFVAFLQQKVAGVLAERAA